MESTFQEKLTGLAIGCFLFASALLSFGTGYAQSELRIEEILVTAQKREENIQDVPAAVSVMSEIQIDRQRITGVEDLVLRVPTFNMNAASSTQATPGLRGATSNNTSPGGDQSVGLFVDEVYYGGSSDWNPDLFDVVSIEVLRGPQGTLFGRNVVGGALNIITRNPADEFLGKINVGIGGFNLFEMSGLVSGPIGGNWYAQIAASSKSRGGLTANTYTSGAGNAREVSETDTLDRQNIRAKLRYQGDNLEWVGTVAYSRDSSSAPGRDFVGPAAPNLDSQFQATNQFPDNSPNTTASAHINYIDADYTTFVSKLTWNTDIGDVVAVTSYRDVKNNESGADIIGTPVLQNLYVPSEESVEQFTQEIRISGTAADRFEYTAGLYYMKQDAFNLQTFYLNFPGGSRLGGFVNAPWGEDFLTASAQNMQIDTTSSAAFFEGSYSLTDSLSVTFGVRYTKDEKDGWAAVTAVDGYNDNFIIPVYSPTELGDDWSKTTPRLILDWSASEDVLLYASYSEGFKSGAFDHAAGPEDTSIALQPETAESTEFGAKTQFLEDRLQLNVAAFQVDYTGAQNGFFDPELNQDVLINLGDLEVQGVELDFTLLASEELTVGGNLAWADSEVAEDDPEFPGNKAALTPEFAGNIWLTYDVDLGNGNALTFAADYTYKDDFFTEISNAENFRTKVDGLINASIEYRPSDSSTIRLWGKNLTDERYHLYSNDLAVFLYPTGYPGAAEAKMPRWNERRTWGLSYSYEF
ncbi:TonB-dependent receptor [Candidatus Foliamicus sp.]